MRGPVGTLRRVVSLPCACSLIVGWIVRRETVKRDVWRPMGVLLVTLLGVAPLHAQTTRELFPHTSDRGRAAVEYEDDALQVVAAYYHSQRNHDSRWLLIEIAVSSVAPMRIRREDISLVTPDGRVVPVASQRTFSQDRERTRELHLSAASTRHPVGGYFRGERAKPFRWFALMIQGGIVSNVFDVDQHRVLLGDLYFASPTGAWEEGTYSLMVQGAGDARAVLPIDLD